MARYRIQEKNPITNEWIDRGWQEADDRKAAIRKFSNGLKVEGTFQATPETSWQPVKIQKVTEIRWSMVDGDDVVPAMTDAETGEKLEVADVAPPREADFPVDLAREGA